MLNRTFASFNNANATAKQLACISKILSEFVTFFWVR